MYCLFGSSQIFVFDQNLYTTLSSSRIDQYIRRYTARLAGFPIGAKADVKE